MNNLLPIIIIGSFAGGFIQGLSGFGFAVIAMSCRAWFLEPQMAATLTLIGALAGQTISALTVRRGFNFKLLLPFLLGGFAGIPIGTTLLPLIDAYLFKALLGGFLLIWCPVMLMLPQLPPIKTGGRISDAVIGICGGIMSGLGGFAGVLPTLSGVLCKGLIRIFKDQSYRILISAFYW